MLNLDLGNIFVDSTDAGRLMSSLQGNKQPEFTVYKENMPALKRAASKFKGEKNLIVLGHGGSINSFKALSCLADPAIRVFAVSTNEPDYLLFLRKKCKPKDTLIVAVSKSGNNVTIIEALLSFQGYKTIAVTESGKTTLGAIAKKNGYTLVRHPAIGGRFAGITSCAYLPLILLGVDVAAIDRGAKAMYKRCCVVDESNPALELAIALFLLELQGYTEVFMPIYSTKLSCFLPLIIQLMHESVCKNGSGQTFYGDLGPESQHHTNQRFFGGRKNVVGLFVRVKSMQDLSVSVPKVLQRIQLLDSALDVIDSLPLSKALDFEFQGVREHTISCKIPFCV
ncbi:MAG: hypothetical protein ABIF10_03660, partial [Candidatus Woesearchaeota archaeon]